MTLIKKIIKVETNLSEIMSVNVIRRWIIYTQYLKILNDLLLIIVIFILQENTQIYVSQYGTSFGCALATVISYNENHSILWAILHGILSWIYIVYYCIKNWIHSEK